MTKIIIFFSAIMGRIDQVNQVLELKRESTCARYNALDKWTQQLSNLHVAVINKTA
jgi:COP9 signalosome complex subunit 2